MGNNMVFENYVFNIKLIHVSYLIFYDETFEIYVYIL